MQTKLPAALKRITAVHHGALDDTLHQPKTRQGSAGIARCFRQDSKKKKKAKTTPACSHARTRALLTVAFTAIILGEKYKQLLERTSNSRSPLPWSWMDI